MTNLAFITLVILVMAFPGYVLRASYYAGTFTRNVLPKSWTDDIAKAVLYSLPLHTAALIALEFLQHHGLVHTTLTFEIAYRVLVGEYDGRLAEIAGTLYRNKLHVGLYYACVLSAAFALGHVFRWIVWKHKLDVRFPWLLRYRNEWLYTLMGRDVPIPREYEKAAVYARIEALTRAPAEQEGKMRLYRGVVEGFTTEESGALRDILITNAERGTFIPNDPHGEQAFEWKAVSPGDLMVLKYSELQNLNVTYLLDVPDSPPPAFETEETAPKQSFPSA